MFNGLFGVGVRFFIMKQNYVSNESKGEVDLINISKKEAELVREKFPNVHIRRTVHKYYMKEAKRALIFISKYRRSGGME